MLVSEPHLGLRVLSCLASPKRAITVVGGEDATHLRFSRYCRRFEPLPESLFHPNSALDAVKALTDICRREGAELIVPAGMDATFLLARIRESLPCASFPLSAPAILEELHDKWSFQKLAAEFAFPHPRTGLLSTEDTPVPEGFDFPFLAKARDRSGGRGVSLVQTQKELDTFLLDARANDRLPIIIQEYVSGLDGSIGILANHGEIVAHSSQLYRADGAGADFAPLPDALESLRSLVAGRRLHGIFQFDLRVDPESGRYWVTECNPRFWASVLLSLCDGADFVNWGIDRAGHAHDSATASDKGSVVKTGRGETCIWPRALLSGIAKHPGNARQASRASRNLLRFTASDLLPYIFGYRSPS